ncbi:hypothetical protein PCE1_002115 [Barthelona sp. PCE]
MLKLKVLLFLVLTSSVFAAVSPMVSLNGCRLGEDPVCCCRGNGQQCTIVLNSCICKRMQLTLAPPSKCSSIPAYRDLAANDLPVPSMINIAKCQHHHKPVCGVTKDGDFVEYHNECVAKRSNAHILVHHRCPHPRRPVVEKDVRPSQNGACPRVNRPVCALQMNRGFSRPSQSISEEEVMEKMHGDINIRRRRVKVKHTRPDHYKTVINKCIAEQKGMVVMHDGPCCKVNLRDSPCRVPKEFDSLIMELRAKKKNDAFGGRPEPEDEYEYITEDSMGGPVIRRKKAKKSPIDDMFAANSENSFDPFGGRPEPEDEYEYITEDPMGGPVIRRKKAKKSPIDDMFAANSENSFDPFGGRPEPEDEYEYITEDPMGGPVIKKKKAKKSPIDDMFAPQPASNKHHHHFLVYQPVCCKTKYGKKSSFPNLYVAKRSGAELIHPGLCDKNLELIRRKTNYIASGTIDPAMLNNANFEYECPVIETNNFRVCGFDGVTYASECFANKFGTFVLYEGKC